MPPPVSSPALASLTPSGGREGCAARPDPGPSALRIALGAAAALAVAMGVGRFAFTPMLPLMLADGRVDIAGGSMLATANYLGYLLGALAVMPTPGVLARMGLAMPGDARVVRGALVATALLTLAMAVGWAPAWPVLRFVTGITSAFALVHVTAWAMRALGGRGRLELGGLIFTGPCAGILVTGVIGWALGRIGAGSAVAWAVYGLLGLGLCALIRPVLQDGVAPRPPRPAGSAGAGPRDPVTVEQAVFSIAYVFAGFGYIITATFLPVIARGTLGETVLTDLFWPMFGLAGIGGALATRHIPVRIDPRLMLVGCYIVQGIGVVLGLVVPTELGFALGAMLLGLPFTAITLFAVRDATRQRPNSATAYIAFLSAALGVGQIAGPPFTAWLVSVSPDPATGFAHALECAGAGLALGAALYLLSAFCWKGQR